MFVRTQRSANAASLAAGLVAIAACASYEPKPLDASSSARRLGRRSLSDPGLAAFARRVSDTPAPAWPPQVWDLPTLTLAGLYFHPDLDVARAAWAVAKAGGTSAAQRPNPLLNVTPSYDVSGGTLSPWALATYVNLKIETAGKRTARMELADQRAETARYHVAEVAWQIRDHIRRALISLNIAQNSQALLERQQALEAENVRRMGEQLAAGAVSSFELMQARLAAQTSLLALRDTERRATEARVALATGIGVAPEALAEIALAYDALDRVPPSIAASEARSRALTNRADILSALSVYAESEAALRLEIANQYPDLQLGPGYSFDTGSHTWSLGLLNLPLPVLNQHQGPIAEAEARRSEAAARFLALQLRVLDAVARARAAYESARQKQADADAMLAESKARLRQAEAQLSVGALSEADLLTLRLQATTAALSRLGVIAEVRNALADLESAMQRPLILSQDAYQTTPERNPEHARGRRAEREP